MSREWKVMQSFWGGWLIGILCMFCFTTSRVYYITEIHTVNHAAPAKDKMLPMISGPLHTDELKVYHERLDAMHFRCTKAVQFHSTQTPHQNAKTHSPEDMWSSAEVREACASTSVKGVEKYLGTPFNLGEMCQIHVGAIMEWEMSNYVTREQMMHEVRRSVPMSVFYGRYAGTWSDSPDWKERVMHVCRSWMGASFDAQFPVVATALLTISHPKIKSARFFTNVHMAVEGKSVARVYSVGSDKLRAYTYLWYMMQFPNTKVQFAHTTLPLDKVADYVKTHVEQQPEYRTVVFAETTTLFSPDPNMVIVHAFTTEADKQYGLILDKLDVHARIPNIADFSFDVQTGGETYQRIKIVRAFASDFYKMATHGNTGASFSNGAHFSGGIHVFSEKDVDFQPAGFNRRFGLIPRRAALSRLDVAQDLGMAQLPEQFDWTKEMPECATPVYNQGMCGSCWAFATTDATSMSMCIQAKRAGKPVPLPLSTQHTLNCVHASEYGCSGGELQSAFSDLRRDGFVREKCRPYVNGNCKTLQKFTGLCSDAEGEMLPTPTCEPSACYTPETSFERVAPIVNTVSVHVTNFFGMFDGPKTEERMRQHLVKYGPLAIGFMVYDDFTDYRAGVYRQNDANSSKQRGGHAVVIVGYGVEPDGTKYWKCKNSWSAKWGEEGYFRIVRGENNSEIEGEVYAVQSTM